VNDAHRFRWLVLAMRCCGTPIVFYSLVYASIGSLFQIGGFYLDPNMRPVGLILLLVGAGIFLLFMALAFRAFRGEAG
jgi:hypothetical protein